MNWEPHAHISNTKVKWGHHDSVVEWSFPNPEVGDSIRSHCNFDELSLSKMLNSELLPMLRHQSLNEKNSDKCFE